MTKLTYEYINSVAKTYSSRKDFKMLDTTVYEVACRKGYLPTVTSHMPSRAWTVTKLTAEALKYESKTAFNTGSKSAYESARRQGILDSICTHMTPLKLFRTKKEMQEVAALYTSRSDFKKLEPNVYSSACRAGYLSAICAHMPTHKTFDPLMPSMLYYFKIDNVYKVGVTNADIPRRYYKRDRDKISNLHTWHMSTGSEALQWEKAIIALNVNYRYTGATPFTDGTGTTECFTCDVLNLGDKI